MTRCPSLVRVSGILAVLVCAQVHASQFASNMFLNGEYQNGLKSKVNTRYSVNPASNIFLEHAIISRQAAPFKGPTYLPPVKCPRGEDCVLRSSCRGGVYTRLSDKVPECDVDGITCCRYSPPPPPPPPTTQPPPVTRPPPKYEICARNYDCVSLRDCENGEITSTTYVKTGAVSNRCEAPKVCCRQPSTTLTTDGYVIHVPTITFPTHRPESSNEVTKVVSTPGPEYIPPHSTRPTYTRTNPPYTTPYTTPAPTRYQPPTTQPPRYIPPVTQPPRYTPPVTQPPRYTTPAQRYTPTTYPTTPRYQPTTTPATYTRYTTPGTYPTTPRPTTRYTYSTPPVVTYTPTRATYPTIKTTPNREYLPPQGESTNQTIVTVRPPFSPPNRIPTPTSKYTTRRPYQTTPYKPTSVRGEGQLSEPIPNPNFNIGIKIPQICPSAMECVSEEYCNSIGVITDTPVQRGSLSVPLLDCTLKGSAPGSTSNGKCCRDSNYVDPWPVNPAGVCAKRNKNTTPKGVSELDANFAEIPWQAMVLKESTKSLLCGGAIVGDVFVLTTASCVQGVPVSDIRVKGGEWQLGSTNEPLPFQLVGVESVNEHPGYDPATGANDMAMLRLSKRFEFAPHIQPICVSDKDPSPSEQCVTSGWGKQALKIHEEGAIMHVTTTTPLSRSDCGADQSGVCSSTKYDACEFDIGSGLACGNGNVVLKGIYAVENGCGEGQSVRFIKPDIKWINQAFADRSKPLLLLKRF